MPFGSNPSIRTVDVKWIEEQRSLGWPDMHPEDWCHRCGRANPLWWADRESWVRATVDWAESTGREGIICPTCLADLHAARHNQKVMWSVSVDRNYETIRMTATVPLV